MHNKSRLTIAMCAALLVPVVACSGTPQRTASPQQSQSVPAESTRTNAVAAMHGEAFAHAKYRAYADQAEHSGEPRVAQEFRTAAQTELSDHFTREADLVGLGGDTAANLRDAIAGESTESTTMYPGFAAQATAAGDVAAAQLFSAIAGDEAAHARDFTIALATLTGPAGAVVPAGPDVTATSITPGPAKSSGATLANLRTAMQGEAFAFAKYSRYARQAREAGNPQIAQLFSRTARVELDEHFAEQATPAGLVASDVAANLTDAIAGEKHEAESMYPDYAAQADKAGNPRAADLFREIAADEKAHEQAFQQALDAL
ncbi:ferritin family protein [Nocardia nova]|uniref:ferritin family protein n=1 Tax=Nocardia nova TaxID=37330 RepID=UPI00379182E0